jgi:hypothetical protein
MTLLRSYQCDGRTPCGSCRFERRRHHPCVYSDKVAKSQHVTRKARRKTESDHSIIDETSPFHSPLHCDVESFGAEDVHDSRSQHGEDSVASMDNDDCDSPEPSTPDQKPTATIVFQPISLCAVVDEVCIENCQF